MATRFVVGDPASISRTGAITLHAARRLETATAELARAVTDLAAATRGPSARSRLADIRRLEQPSATLAQELASLGAALQGHAEVLAACLAEGRALTSQAEAAGLVIDSGHVATRPGVRGEAIAPVEESLTWQAAALQDALDRLHVRTQTARTRLQRLLTDSTDRLATASATARF